MSLLLWTILNGVLPTALNLPAWGAPKYGPGAVPLSRASQARYFQSHAAPDFWALIPFYVPQESAWGCSAATFSMILNAARIKKEFTDEDPLITYRSLIEKYSDARYRKTMQPGFSLEKLNWSNVSVAQHSQALKASVQKLGLENAQTRIELQVIDPQNLAQSRQVFFDRLKENEKSSDDFIILNFQQSVLTGDPKGGSHVAAVGAYDAGQKRVLILDPDREWYEPYWSPQAKVFEAIADARSDSTPAWIYFKVR